MNENVQEFRAAIEAQRGSVHQNRKRFRALYTSAQERQMDKSVLMSLYDADQALAKYDASLAAQGGHAIEVAKNEDPAAQLALQDAAREADGFLKTAQQHTKEIETLTGQQVNKETGMSRLMGDSWANMLLTSEKLQQQIGDFTSPQHNAPAEVKAQARSIQEELYGVHIEHDEAGRPILPKIETELERGTDHGRSIERERERQQEDPGTPARGW